jgi:hypothetical protein
MGIATGHKKTLPLKLGHRHGLNKITPRHGVPFYSPASVYTGKRLRCSDLLLFTLQATISGGVSRKTNIQGSSQIMFLCDGVIDSSYIYIPPEGIGRIYAKTTIYFYFRGDGGRERRLVGESWIVFGSRLHVRKLSGEADITFTLTGLMNTSTLRASTTIEFSEDGVMSGENTPVNLVVSELIQFSTQAVLLGVVNIEYGFLYNWYAVAGIV